MFRSPPCQEEALEGTTVSLHCEAPASQGEGCCQGSRPALEPGHISSRAPLSWARARRFCAACSLSESHDQKIPSTKSPEAEFAPPREGAHEKTDGLRITQAEPGRWCCRRPALGLGAQGPGGCMTWTPLWALCPAPSRYPGLSLPSAFSLRSPSYLYAGHFYVLKFRADVTFCQSLPWSSQLLSAHWKSK